MKRIFIAAMAVMMVLCLFIVGAGAIESEIGAVGSIASESAAESVFDTSEGIEETAPTVDEVVTETVSTVAEIDSRAVAELIDGVGSKYEAALKLAGIFGISVEDAEALVDNIVVFGDEHFEEDDAWLAVRKDILSNPDKWTIIAIVALGFVALLVFLIRSLIKNTITQTNTKLKLADIDKHEVEVRGDLKELKSNNSDLLVTLEAVKGLMEGEYEELKKENEDLKELLSTVRELIEGESAAVDSLKANSETSLKVTEESALQILQLLYIAMDRKVPIASREARKLWYDDSVAKVKNAAGLSEAKDGESGE